MNIAALTVEESLTRLRTSALGLSGDEAARRLTEYGPNRLEAAQQPPRVRTLVRHYTHIFALILWLAAALAFAAHMLHPGEGMLSLGLAIVGVIVVNGVFSHWQEHRAERALAALEQLLPAQTVVMRDGILRRIASDALVLGDIIALSEGDFVPADCRVIVAFGLRVNNATVTGESAPQYRDAQPDAEPEIYLARNFLLAGTTVVSGEARAAVIATGMNTEFGRIAHLAQTAGEAPSPLQRETARLSRVIALLSAGIGLTCFAIGELLGISFWFNFVFAIGVIVANVPEGLLPTVTLSLAMATQRMARRNALVRHLPAVEALGGATVILSDKTGTLTRNEMTVVALGTHAGLFEAQSPAAYTQLARLPELLHCAALNRALKHTGDDRGTTSDPTEAALAEFAQAAGADVIGWKRVGELPFDSTRRRMSNIHAGPTARMLYCKGAPETVLALCTQAQAESGPMPLDAPALARWQESERMLAGRGLRVLALAWKPFEGDEPSEADETGLTLAGLVGLEDPPRPEVPGAIARCKQAGIRVIMVTGDHPHTAAAIARQIGL
ncbi:MAG: cation-translocating P-type ATPase, partial [Burkholderiales bacterium]